MLPSRSARFMAYLVVVLTAGVISPVWALQWANADTSDTLSEHPRDQGDDKKQEDSDKASLAVKKKVRSEGDMCATFAANTNPIVWHSYGLGTPTKPHLSSLLCDSPGDDEAPRDRRHRQALIFKVARSGSTWLTALLRQAGLQTFFEPFCDQRCYHKADMKDEELAIKTLLTHRCSSWQSKCQPATTDNCEPMTFAEGQKTPITAISLNPRFSDRIRWSTVLQDGKIDAEIVNLRRTNLVSMAYSKFHHGGCPPQSNGPRRRFDLAMLLACIWEYGIGDQEFASYTALWAAASRGRKPLLVLYEDVVNSGEATEAQILEPLGFDVSKSGKGPIIQLNHLELDPLDPINSSHWDVAMEMVSSEEWDSRTELPPKLHSSDICQYPDVSCDSLRHSLMHYPCLRKQLEVKSASVAWTMPMLPNRTISLAGDCKPLSYLRPDPGTNKAARRTYSELYQATGNDFDKGKVMVYRDMEEYASLRRKRQAKHKKKDDVKHKKEVKAAKARKKDLDNIVKLVTKH